MAAALVTAHASHPWTKQFRHAAHSHTRLIRVFASARSAYEQLGVPEDASPDEVKRAFRRAARTLHPDVNPDPEATEQFIKVLKAYQALSDSTSRSSYDLQMGMTNARAKDPRFARFERWRREVVPMLEIYLEEWSQEVDQIILGWLGTLDNTDTTLQSAIAMMSITLQQSLDAQAPTLAVGQQTTGQQTYTQAAGLGVPAQVQAGVGVGVEGRAQGLGLAESREQELQQRLLQMTATLMQLEAGVQGGLPRVAQYVEKRFEQVSTMFPAYPELVWEKEWYDAADAWLDKMEAAIQPWKLKLQIRMNEVQQLQSRHQRLQRK